MIRLFMIASFLVVSSASVCAGEKRVLFGAQTAPDGSTYEIGFCARGKNAEGEGPGHAFVVLQSFDKHNHRTDFLTAGFGPPKSKPIHGYGLISPESYSDSSQECLVAAINKAKYLKIKGAIEAQTEFSFAGVIIPLERPYVVAFDDCVTFMQAVATDLGLKVPSRIEGLAPLSYVAGLKKAN